MNQTTTNNKFADFSMGDLVSALLHYRNEIADIKAETSKRTERPQKMIDAIEAELKRLASEQGLRSIPCDVGTLSMVDTSHYNITDPVEFQKFILSQRDLSYYGKKIQKAAVTAYQQAHGTLPPGVGSHVERSIRFTAKK